MAALYELTNSYRDLMLWAESEELDPEALADTLEGIQGTIEEKFENYGKVLRMLAADSDAIKAEEERLHSRRTAIDNNIKRMKEALQNSMELMETDKIKTNLFSFGIQNNPPSVQIADGTKIPEVFLIEQEPKIDRKGILEALKGGKEIEGCSIVQSRGLRIR